MSIDIAFVWQEYEVRWHCIPGTGSTRCNWFPTCVWSSNPDDLTSTRIVNTTSFTEEMTKYDTVFVFEITIITPRGRSPPYQVYAYIAPLNGMPRNFSCDITMNNTLLMCQWSPPTDFNATGFTVSNNSTCQWTICVNSYDHTPVHVSTMFTLIR